MRTLPCFKCGEKLKGMLERGNQPLHGLSFTTSGQYFSGAFDSIDGALLEINICDRCIVRGRANVLHLEEIPKRQWRDWQPEELPNHLAALGE